MKIVIAGAGDVGFHLAKLLSNESQDTYVIDSDAKKLKYIDEHLDVITLKGDATSIKTLKDVGIQYADLLLAVTESQNTNLTVAALSKKLGVKKTIARISNTEFLTTDEINFAEVGIDYMISPEYLAAQEIEVLLKESVFNDKIEFENGLINILGARLSSKSPLVNKTVQEAKEEFYDINFTTISLKRENTVETIIPRGNTLFKHHDQVYFSVTADSVDKIYKLIGKEKIGIKEVMILGGSKIGQKAAKSLCSNEFNVKLIERNRDRAFELADSLCDALIVQGDGRNVELLEEESLANMDAFVAVTGNSETNIMSCLVAKSKGVKKTIALVENMDYINISQTIGIDTLINKKLLAASAIFRHVRKGKVLALANLHNVDAEVLEFFVRRNSKVTKGQIKDINLTKKAVIGGVVRKGEAMMTFGNFQIEKGDRVIIFCLPEAIGDVEKLFNN
ncbi:Trk system potassium transporter TrkA [Flavicella sediminum]|uniref:Trk system potassium transporter TrkA n=1 Tax=Flavicella sediminum TaxID=2585141 RepID=UPI00111E76A5|nr:Trk system potassium transporter TrkA [Flavicella sediminum]